MAMNRRLGQMAYGSLFTFLLPALLAVWAWRLDHSAMVFWPIPFGPLVGWCLAFIGVGLMLISMRALWVTGKGLPMNAYPPLHYVTESTYRVLSHPIYVGFVCLVGGVSIAANSSAGLWVITPIVALSAVALVAGYEGPRLRQRFGDAVARSPIFGVPEADPAAVSLLRRLAAAAITLGPWAVIYSVFSKMPMPQGAHDLRMAWEYGVPALDWMVLVYSAAYPIAIAGPLLLRTQVELRRYVIGAWLATLLGFALMLVIPGEAVLLPLSGDGFVGRLADANRALDAEWLAFPSFHALWIVFAFYCFRSRFAQFARIWALMAALICASCVLTGAHAVVDVLSGLALGVLCWHHEAVWSWMVRCAEAISNSWAAIEVGPVRIISHAVWSAVAATAGLLVVFWLVGPGLVVESAMVFGAGLVVAGAWGYWLEGGGRLSRPFGYYGFLFGSIAALAILALFDVSVSQRLIAAFACGAPLAQSIGRLRCLVQGCCHGRPVMKVPGIRVVHPKSRVTAMSYLQGIPIHPTQVYSIASNLFIFGCLWRLWESGSTATFIGGLYLVLSSLARFVEEQYRGEPQTPKLFDLAVYQWLAIALLIVGIAVSMIDGMPMQVASVITWPGALTSLAAGLLAAAFMSIDFPLSQWRFSRLTVSESQ
jgi:hypothetical protein